MKFVNIIISLGILIAQDPPESFNYIPTNNSGVFQGQATINGNPASGDDWVAAFDEGGNCAGANQIVISNSIVYINLVIYGDDGTSSDVDEGMNGGEEFVLKLWISSLDTVIEFPESFDCWNSNNGAPMVGCGDVNTVYNFLFEELSLSNHDIPYKVSLNQNYPNPFNMKTTISFNIDISGFISLEIYDFRGRKVKNLIQKNFDSGEYSIIWHGENNQGDILPSGVYSYRLFYSKNDRVGFFTKKMVIIK